MINNNLIIFLLLIFSLSGCANMLPPSPQERIAQFQTRCISMGFQPQTSEYSHCVLELEKAYLSRRGHTSQSVSSSSDDARINRQILNHGAGGCTPNFATGGCL